MIFLGLFRRRKFSLSKKEQEMIEAAWNAAKDGDGINMTEICDKIMRMREDARSDEADGLCSSEGEVRHGCQRS